VLVVAGLIYSLPMLFEVRMSPQFHYWIYGIIQQTSFKACEMGDSAQWFSWAWIARGVFYDDYCCSGNSVVANARCDLENSSSWDFSLSRSRLGFMQNFERLVYAAVMVPLVRFSNPKLQVRVAAIFVSIALAYPTLRTFGLFPTTSIIEVASSISAERSDL